jgi:two-component system, OmpR family, sensor histidine kinase VicK
LASSTDNTINNNNKKTEILFGNSNVISAELRFFLNSKKRIDTCMNYTRPQMAIVLEPMKKAFVDAKTKGVRLRYVIV